MMLKNVYLLLLFNLFCLTKAQVAFHFRILGHIQLGTPINRIGLVIHTGIIYQQLQVFTQFRSHLYLTSWVKNKPTPELQCNIGTLLSWHKLDSLLIHEILYQNFTARSNCVGYVYHIYLDKIKTSQHSGSLVLQIKQFAFIFENDVLAGKGKDEFRTGGCKILYQINNNHSVAIHTTLWTGQTYSAIRIDTSQYPSKYGYKDLSYSLYGNQSKGILALQYNYLHPFCGIMQTNIGIDAEPIRHIFQNKLIHDMPFIPQKWNKAHNPHYPMIDIEGKPFVNLQNQKIRKAKPYFQIGINPTSFY